MADTVYEMLVKIGLEHSAVMLGLGAIGTKLFNLAKQADSTKLAIAGIGSIVLGTVTIDGIVKIMDKTKELSAEIVKMKNLGGDMNTFASSGEAMRRAFEISRKIKGLAVGDILKIPNEIYSIVGKEEADKLWEPLAKYSSLMQNVGGFKTDPTANLRAMVKGGEALGMLTDSNGKFDEAKTMRFLELMVKIQNATGKMVSERDLYAFSKTAGFTGRNLSDEGFMTEMAMTQIMGGPRAGTATISTWAQLAKGVLTAKTAQGMQDIGLLKPGDWYHDKSGVHINPEREKQLTAIFAKDPLLFAGIIRRNLESMGITDPTEQMRAVSNALGRQTTQRFTTEMVMNFDQMIQERARMAMGLGMGKSLDNRETGDVGFAENALSQSWNNMLASLGSANIENYIKFLNGLTSFLNDTQAAILAIDPNMMRLLGVGIAAIGAALIGAGAIALLGALGTGGWLIAAFTTLAAINWDKMKQFWSWVQTGASILRTIDEWSMYDTEKGNKALNWLKNLLPETPPIGPNDNQRLRNVPDPNFSPTSWTPGGTKQTLQPVQVILNLDGRTFGQAVIDILQDLTMMPNSAPAFDGRTAMRTPTSVGYG